VSVLLLLLLLVLLLPLLLLLLVLLHLMLSFSPTGLLLWQHKRGRCPLTVASSHP